MTYTGSFPLDWPEGWQRNAWRERSRFKIVSLSNSIAHLELELDRLGADDVVISSDARTDRSGRIIGQQRKTEDTGVAVYFQYAGKPYAIACDLYVSLPENVRAVATIIQDIRGLDRRGIDNAVGRVLAGFTALPAGVGSSSVALDPWAVLKVRQGDSRSTIRARYLELVKVHHPDNGGDPERFHEVQAAYARILEVTA